MHAPALPTQPQSGSVNGKGTHGWRNASMRPSWGPVAAQRATPVVVLVALATSRGAASADRLA